MKQVRSGFVMIDALLSFLMVTLIVSLLARSVITMSRQEQIREEQRKELQDQQWQWWQESMGGCRDTCLIDALIYPLN